MIPGLQHFAEALFWVVLVAWLIVAFVSAIDALMDWGSARVVYRPHNVVDFEKRRRLQLEATMRGDERPIADEARTAGRGAALATIVRANRSVGGRS